MRDLGWQPLAERRATHKIILFYKITNKIYPDYLHQLLPIQQEQAYTLRHVPRIPVYKTCLKSMANSFFPSAVRAWNQIPQTLADSESVKSLQHKLKPKMPISLPYYTKCTGRHGIWLTRLRLGLSALKAHRQTYNLIGDPTCDHCGLHETTVHYMFQCQHYTYIRNIMYNKLTQLNINITDTSQLLNTILHGTRDKTLNTSILSIVFEFFKDSNRFV